MTNRFQGVKDSKEIQDDWGGGDWILGLFRTIPQGQVGPLVMHRFHLCWHRAKIFPSNTSRCKVEEFH